MEAAEGEASAPSPLPPPSEPPSPAEAAKVTGNPGQKKGLTCRPQRRGGRPRRRGRRRCRHRARRLSRTAQSRAGRARGASQQAHRLEARATESTLAADAEGQEAITGDQEDAAFGHGGSAPGGLRWTWGSTSAGVQRREQQRPARAAQPAAVAEAAGPPAKAMGRVSERGSSGGCMPFPCLQRAFSPAHTFCMFVAWGCCQR